MARITVEKLGGGIHSNDRRVENFSFMEKKKKEKVNLENTNCSLKWTRVKLFLA